MPVPILLVTGFLGAGKTTAVNHLLAGSDGRRIAAVVNDFGAVNIDAELIAGATDGVVSLPNGCICCTLEGDLLRTLAALLRRTPCPDSIVIETSGAADPAGIVRNLMDPLIWREAPLETVLCLVDASTPDRLTDPLCRAQLAAADLVALTKLDLAPPGAEQHITATLQSLRPGLTVLDATNTPLPMALLFPGTPPTPRLAPQTPGRPRPAADRFDTTTWTAPHPISLPRLQAAITRLAPRLVRAKGLFTAIEHPGRPLLLQLASGRATVGPVTAPAGEGPPVRLVFIYELGNLSAAEINTAMAACLPS